MKEISILNIALEKERIASLKTAADYNREQEEKKKAEEAKKAAEEATKEKTPVVCLSNIYD